MDIEEILLDIDHYFSSVEDPRTRESPLHLTKLNKIHLKPKESLVLEECKNKHSLIFKTLNISLVFLNL